MGAAYFYHLTRSPMEATLPMLIDRALTDRAAPGQRYARPPPAREQRPQHEDRRAHRFHELVWRYELADARSVDDDVAVALVRARLDTHPAQQLHRRLDVVEMRHVAQCDG